MALLTVEMKPRPCPARDSATYFRTLVTFPPLT